MQVFYCITHERLVVCYRTVCAHSVMLQLARQQKYPTWIQIVSVNPLPVTRKQILPQAFIRVFFCKK